MEDSAYPDQKRKDNRKGSYENIYMVPLKSHQEDKNQYEQPQVSVLSLTKMKVPVYESTTTQHQSEHTELNEEIRHEANKKKKKSMWYIVICVIITIFAVVTLIALAISALSYSSAQQDESYNTQQFGTEPMSGAVSEESLIQNYTHLMKEISALNALVGQLNSNTQRNISQLYYFNNQFSFSLNSTMRSIISTDIRSVSSLSQSFQSLISTNIPSVSDQISMSAASLYTQFHSVSTSLNGDISRISGSLNQQINSANITLFTKINRLSTSVTNRLNHPYQTCNDYSRICLISGSNNRRLSCTTLTLPINRLVS